MKLKVLKNKFVYFELYEKGESDTLLVIMSGISGGKDSFLIRKSLQFFKKYNLNILSINFCKDDIFYKSDCPRMEDVDFDFYLGSLYRCIKSLDKSYKEIIFIGHSLSAVISILFYKKYSSSLKCGKLIIWDPSVPSQISSSIKDNFIFDRIKNIYKSKSTQYKFVLKFSKKFVDDLERNTDIVSVLNTLGTSVLFIGAEKGAKENAVFYFNKTHGEKILKIIKDTGHMFGTSFAKKELFTTTLNFLDLNKKEGKIKK